MSSYDPWALIALCAVVTIAIKGVGPVALGNRDLPPWFQRIVRFTAPALLAALVCVSAFSHGHRLGLGANTAGVAAAGLILLRGASVIVAVVVAATLTALLRAL